jgi:hypothetical protein
MAEAAGATIEATFNTRRQADLAVEHLVQELGIERTDIFLAAEGDANSAGSVVDGADAESGHPGVDPAGDPALAGGIAVSIDVADEAVLPAIRSTLEDYGGKDIAAE